MIFWLGIVIKYTGFRGLCSYSLTGRAVLQGLDLEMCQWKNSLPGLDDGKILAGNPYIYFYILQVQAVVSGVSIKPIHRLRWKERIR